MSPRLRCCETCALREFGDTEISLALEACVKAQLLALRDRPPRIEYNNLETELTPAERLAAHVCAALIDSGDCDPYGVVQREHAETGIKYLALLTNECQFLMLE